MFERFTDGARHVLVLGQEEARRYGHGWIGTEHILLGLLREGQGLASTALADLGISLDKARAKVEAILGPDQPQSTNDSPPFTPRAKKVLELSLREALQLGDNNIATEHLLLGLVREGDGVAAQVLVALGAGLPRVREHVLELMGRAGEAGGRVVTSGLWSAGRRCTFEVVRAGRTEADSDAAFAELAELLRGVGLDLEALDKRAVRVSSVQTMDGPGIRLVFRHLFD